MPAAEVNQEPTPARYEPPQTPSAERRAPSADAPPSADPRPSAEPSASSPWTELLLVFALVAFALLLIRLPAEFRLPGAFNDDGVYLALGKALAGGEGYRNVYLVGAPPQVKFPPGLPAVHALLWMLFGTLDRVAVAASLLGVVAAGAGAACLWWFGRTRLAIGRGVLALCAIGPMLLVSAVDYWTLPITEAWFLLAWAVLLLLLERRGDEAPALRHAALAGVVIALATLFRTQAITLLPAALLALALRKRWRDAAALAAVAIPPIAVWQLWASRAQAALGRLAAPDDAGYTDWIPAGAPLRAVRALGQAVAWNVDHYAGTFANHVGRPKWVGMLLFGAFVALAVAGAWRLRRARPALVLSVTLALVLLVLWPSPQDRLLFPVLPFMGLMSAAATAWLLRGLPVRARPAAMAVGVLVVGTMALRQAELRATTPMGIRGEGKPAFRSSSYFLPRNSRIIATMAQWARTEGRPDDRVLASLPSGLWLLSGRPTMSGDPNESILALSVWSIPGDFVRARIRDDGITAIVVDTPDRPLARDLRVLWERCPDGFTNVGVGPWDGFPAVFRVHRADPCLQQLLTEPRRA